MFEVRKPCVVDLAVDLYLSEIDVSYSAAHVVLTTDENKWLHDVWAISFARAQKPALTSAYKTGIGHRILTAAERQYGKARERLRNSTSLGWVRKRTLPKKPFAACVLHSLLLNADSGNMLFEEFCANFGYDTDSRKAFAVYEACQKVEADLRRFLSRAEREKLAELLADY